MSYQNNYFHKLRGAAGIASLTLLGLSGSAHASLGGAPGGTGLTRVAALHSAPETETSQAQPYSTQNSITDGGTTVREYIDRDGGVFAVTWKGPFMPNLSVLLGEYFAQYTDTSASQPPTHSMRFVHNENLVVQSTGRMHAFSGIAYLPQKLPAGVTADSLK
jgi:hypothetical protein